MSTHFPRIVHCSYFLAVVLAIVGLDNIVWLIGCGVQLSPYTCINVYAVSCTCMDCCFISGTPNSNHNSLDGLAIDLSAIDDAKLRVS